MSVGQRGLVDMSPMLETDRVGVRPRRCVLPFRLN